MIPYQLYAAVKAGLQDEMGKVKDKLARGHWHGEHEGKRLCGEVDGLERAARVLQEQYEKLERLEENDID